MKFAIVSLNRKALEQEVRKAGFRVDRKKPDIVICVGGDGTLLFGELEYPEVPKFFLKHRCRNCTSHGFDRLCRKLEAGKYKIVEEAKIQGTVNRNPRKRLVALNEISIHYKLPCAIGLDVNINRKKTTVVGDGIVVATPYGSTGYFHSITRKTFRKGFGIAFSNPVKRTAHRVLPENAVVNARVVKGNGWLAADCSKRLVALKTGDTVEIKKHPRKARMVVLAGKTF